MRGTRKLNAEFIFSLKKLIKLEYVILGIYEVSISRLESATFKAMFEEFKLDHQRHISQTSKFLKLYNEIPPIQPSAKTLLAQGKVILANLAGDKAILQVMRDNEIATYTAYENINNYEKIPEMLQRTLKQGMQDEKCHLTWVKAKLSYLLY